MLTFFVLMLFLSAGFAHFAQQRYETALKRGRSLAIPGGRTVAEVVQAFLEANGAADVRMMKHNAMVSDYLDSGRRCLFLNSSVMNGTDAASLAIAMHEAAHALQKDASAPALKWRETTIRMTRYLPTLVPLGLVALTMLERVPLSIMLRSILMVTGVLWFLIMVMSAMSLPIEFNASRRALAFLENKLPKNPRFVEAMTDLLRDVAFRDTGAFVRSPVYCLFGLLPMGGRLRPSK